MEFSIGETVEICCAEDGFWGSYFVATILEKKPENKYLVQYTTLVTEEDDKVYLKDTVDGRMVRPLPPKKKITAFKDDEMVDVYANEGWWEGRIAGKHGSKYSVYFETTGKLIKYPANRLRRHYEYVSGDWFTVL